MRRILAAIVALLGAALPVSAATVRYRTDAELVALSDRVVRGRVLDSVVERAPTGAIRTRTRLAVVEDFTGGAETEITILERGGRLADGTIVWIPGTPQFAPGDDVVLCLQQTNGGYRTVSLAFSAFGVGAAAAGNRSLTRFGGVTVVGDGSSAAARGAVDAVRTLGEFRRAASTVTGVASRVVLTDAAAAAAVIDSARGRVEQPYTLLGPGIRWRQADSGQAIAWYRNTFRPSPIQGADTDDQIRTALAAWTDPPTASITLAFGGSREVAIQQTPGEDPYCTAGNLGVGLITFGDPLNDPGLAVGVLAIGGGCGTSTTHVVNGVVFSAFTHGLVVFNEDAALNGYRTVPNITRILEHEIGHGIGLDHTDQGTDNIMYPSCCFANMPVPPAIGPDDLAGLVFIYPMPVCTFTLSPSGRIDVSPEGGPTVYTVIASGSTCAWTAGAVDPWISFLGRNAGTGNGEFTVLVPPNLAQPSARTSTITVGLVAATLRQVGDFDGNADGLFDFWASFYGLDTSTPQGSPGGDPDGDGVSNLAEQAAGTHPRGTVQRYLAEGAGNAFFDTEIALFNPEITPARVLLRIQPDSGGEVNWPMVVPGLTRRTMSPTLLEALTVGSFSTLVEADASVVVDRTMRWDATGYGAHAETAVASPSTTWYLAEGSTSGDFVLFYLLQNPGATGATATVRFLRPAPQPPIDRSYTLAPRSRLTIPVDSVTAELANTDVSAIVTSTQPLVVERSMYLNRPGQAFGAGHESAGVTAPATSWFLAEGSTGSFFDVFLLIENPSATAAAVRVDYLLPSGTVHTKAYAVAGQSRFTIYVDDEQLPAGSGLRPLANTALAMRVSSTNAVPIIVERSMWWPQPAWYEAHNAPGTTATATRWATAGGFAGGPTNAETFILIANTGATPGSARVTVVFESGPRIAHEFSLPAQSRTNVPVSPLTPLTAGQRFSVLVESLGASPAPLVVERAMYHSPGGVTWAAGTAVVATPLTP